VVGVAESFSPLEDVAFPDVDIEGDGCRQYGVNRRGCCSLEYAGLKTAVGSKTENNMPGD
jgi:hypothetical protein